MGAPSDQFLHLLWRPPYVFFSYYMGAPGIISLHTILGPPDHFLRLLYGALRSVSSHTIWGPLSDQFHCLLYVALPLRSVSLHAIGGPPHVFKRILLSVLVIQLRHGLIISCPPPQDIPYYRMSMLKEITFLQITYHSVSMLLLIMQLIDNDNDNDNDNEIILFGHREKSVKC